jgi:hypothetical protein
MNEINITPLLESKDLLEDLVERVRLEFDKAIANEEILPKDNIKFITKINDFSYTDNGPKILNSSKYFYIKKELKGNICGNVITRTRESSEFKKLKHAIGIGEDERNSELPMPREVDEMYGNLVNFVSTLHNILFPDSEYRNWTNDKIVEYFLSRWKKEPVLYTTTAEMIGIVYLAKRSFVLTIEGNIKISLRGITREDLEQDVSATTVSLGWVKPYVINEFCPCPSILMTIKLMSKDSGDIRKIITKCLAVLRLFKVAGVNIVSHKTCEDIVLGYSTTDNITPNIEEHLNAFGSYTINDGDLENLSIFFEKIYRYLPDNISDSSRIAA